MTEKKSFRNIVLDLFTEQFTAGDESLDMEPIIARILDDRELTVSAVHSAVLLVRREACKLIRGKIVRNDRNENTRGGAASRFIASIVDYGLTLLDVQFGGKRLGDYLPEEAITYASIQHESARTIGIQSRFVASVAKACPDASKPIREQITAERAEAIRKFVIESSPNQEAAAEALAVA